jgi:hypothetical protein
MTKLNHEQRMTRARRIAKKLKQNLASEEYGVVCDALNYVFAEVLVLCSETAAKQLGPKPEYELDYLLDRAALHLRSQATHLRNVRVLGEELLPPVIEQ